jgi:hypothetical protein
MSEVEGQPTDPQPTEQQAPEQDPNQGQAPQEQSTQDQPTQNQAPQEEESDAAKVREAQRQIHGDPSELSPEVREKAEQGGFQFSTPVTEPSPEASAKGTTASESGDTSNES